MDTDCGGSIPPFFYQCDSRSIGGWFFCWGGTGWLGLDFVMADDTEVVPPGDFALFFYQCLSESIGGWCFEWWRLGFFSGF